MKKILIVSLVFNLILIFSFTKTFESNDNVELMSLDTTFIVEKYNRILSYKFSDGILKELKIKQADSFRQTINFYDSGMLNNYSKDEIVGMKKGTVIHDFDNLSVDSLGNIYSILISEEGKQILCLYKSDDKYYDVCNMKENIVYEKGCEVIKILPVPER